MPDNWIRITDNPDSLPECKKPVLCFRPPDKWGIGHRYFEHYPSITWRYNTQPTDTQPTHWQPLPEPPRE